MAGSAYKDAGETDQRVALARERKQLSNRKLYRKSHTPGFTCRMPHEMQYSQYAYTRNRVSGTSSYSYDVANINRAANHLSKPKHY